MHYFPLVKSANPVARIPLGPEHTVVLFDQIVAAGQIHYAFLVAVYHNSTQEPCYFVSSEVNALADQRGGGSHFLCLFDGDGHANLGASDDWGDPRKFFPKALELAGKHFGIPDPPNQG